LDDVFLIFQFDDVLLIGQILRLLKGECQILLLMKCMLLGRIPLFPFLEQLVDTSGPCSYVVFEAVTIKLNGLNTYSKYKIFSFSKIHFNRSSTMCGAPVKHRSSHT
jgi:hypothetical protein